MARERDDAEETEEVEEEPTDVTEDIARRAARRIARGDNPPDEDDPDDPEDEDLADDETTKQWLEDVIKTPEIRSIIKSASERLAERVASKSIAELRTELTEDFETRLAEVRRQLASGDITREEADEEAEEIARRTARRAERDAAEDAERETKAKDREERVRTREVQAYAKEQLAGLDKNSIIPEIVRITPGMSEEDVDDLIADARDAYVRVRRRVIEGLKAQGWRSPKDLRTLAEEEDEVTLDPDEDEEETSPPTRDTRDSGGRLSKARRQNLRERFGYAKDRRVA